MTTNNELAIILMVAHKATQELDGFTDCEFFTLSWTLIVLNGRCSLRPGGKEFVLEGVDYNTLQEWVREESAGVVN